MRSLSNLLLTMRVAMSVFRHCFLVRRCSLILLLAVAGCAPAPEVPADIIFLGGTVWTGVPGSDPAQAVAVKGGFIQAVGTDREVRALRGEGTEVVRLGGRMVLPGFIDSHTHFIDGGFQLSSVDLRDADSPEEFARRIKEFAETLPPGTWILGGDWDHERWGGELPSRKWIDEGTPEHPVLVTRLDQHMALANSLALELAGVSASTRVPFGGEMVRVPGTNELTGILRNEAMGLVRRVIPEPTEEELDQALDAAMEHALARGVTQTHDMGTWEHLETYRRARDHGRLQVRVYSVVPIDTWERLVGFMEENGPGDDWHWWGGLKGFVDGSLGSTTAWFYEPYTDSPETSGLLTTDTASLRRWIAAADEAGLQVIVHAIGDRANDWILDVYQATAERNGPRDRRFRIEHAQHLTEDALPRFAAQEIMASMQPYHAIDDGRWAENRIGPERIRTTFAFRSLLDAGASLAFGSDWTVAPMCVMEGIYAAVTRRTLDGENPDGWVPEERITLEETLKAYTWGSARAGFMEDKLGRLEPGRYADLVILSRDLFQMDPVDIPSVQVEMTMVEGAVVYRNEG